jgi:hypothetical protein
MRSRVYSVLVTSAVTNDPRFDLDEWALRVRVAIDTEDRKPRTILCHRLEWFKVHGQTTCRQLTHDIPKHPLWPHNPPKSASVQLDGGLNLPRDRETLHTDLKTLNEALNIMFQDDATQKRYEIQ